MENPRFVEAKRATNSHRYGSRFLHYKIHFKGTLTKHSERWTMVHSWIIPNHSMLVIGLYDNKSSFTINCYVDLISWTSHKIL